MSDNIDYAELDKAVNEAIQTRSAAKPVSSKPITRPNVQRPHGQFMDLPLSVTKSDIQHLLAPN